MNDMTQSLWEIVFWVLDKANWNGALQSWPCTVHRKRFISCFSLQHWQQRHFRRFLNPSDYISYRYIFIAFHSLTCHSCKQITFAYKNNHMKYISYSYVFSHVDICISPTVPIVISRNRALVNLDGVNFPHSSPYGTVL